MTISSFQQRMLCGPLPGSFNRTIRLLSISPIRAEALAANARKEKPTRPSKRLAPTDVGHRIKAVSGRSQFIFDLLSLQKYYELYGNTMVPHKFHFYQGEPGTGHAGASIGTQVNHLRAYAKIDPNCVPTELRQTLDNMGFVWDVPKHRLELALKGVLTYKSIHGHDLIPQKFVVPHDDPRWDRDLWGIKLGMTFLNIKRQHRSTDNRKSVFEAAGIDVQLNRCIKAERLVEAVQLYKSMYVLPQRTSGSLKDFVDGKKVETNNESHTTSSDNITDTSDSDVQSIQFTVPSTFIFPEDHPDIPPPLRGYQLGYRVNKLRRGDYKQVRESILSTGLIANL